MIYYSTQRPVSPGTYPVPKKNDPRWDVVEIINIYNFDYRTYIPEIEKRAWGFIVYSGRIPEQEAEDYELVLWSEEPEKN